MIVLRKVIEVTSMSCLLLFTTPWSSSSSSTTTTRSTTTEAFQLGLPNVNGHVRQQRHASFDAWNEKPSKKRRESISSFAAAGVVLDDDDNDKAFVQHHQQQQPFLRRIRQHKAIPPRTALSLSSSSSDENDSSSSSPKAASDAQQQQQQLASELSGTLIRLMAQFVTSELKSLIQERGGNDQQHQQQLEQLQETMQETQQAQETLLPTWKAAKMAIEENMDNNKNNNINNNNNSPNVSVLAVHDTDEQRGDKLPLNGGHSNVVEKDDRLQPSPLYNNDVPSIGDNNIIMDDETTTKSADSSPKLPVAIFTGDDEDDTAAGTREEETTTYPTIPSAISMQFGRPLEVVGGVESKDNDDNAITRGVVGSKVTSPPSMSLSSRMSNDDHDDRLDDHDTDETVTSRDDNYDDHDDGVDSSDEISTSVQDHEDGTDASTFGDETSESIQSDPTWIETISKTVSDQDATAAVVASIAPTTQPVDLAAKYASIESLEERAFTILLDLGLIQITPDPDDPNYDHSKDDEFCSENVWKTTPP